MRYTGCQGCARFSQKNPSSLQMRNKRWWTSAWAKNMVRSIRFLVPGGWSRSQRERRWIFRSPNFGIALLGERGELTRFWKTFGHWAIPLELAHGITSPLLAWDLLSQSLGKSQKLALAQYSSSPKRSHKRDASPSPVTLERSFSTPSCTPTCYSWSQGEVQEDNLDCPLVELELIVKSVTGSLTVL